MTSKPESRPSDVVDLAAMARSTAARGPAWTHQSDDLNVNLLVFPGGEGVAAHVNAEVDVLLVGIAGDGVVEVDGRPIALGSGQALVVPKGARRSIRPLGDCFAYLTCHRRRAGLWPTSQPRPRPRPNGGDAEPAP